MSDADLIERLAAAVAARVAPAIPLSVDLWDVERIAAYLKRSREHVAERVVCLPGFPRPIRIPSAARSRGGQPLWKAAEVIQWTEQHQEKGIRR